MKNLDIRTEAKNKGVYLYNVAEAMGISEPTMTRKLRRELPENEKEKIFKIINKLSEGGEVNA